MPAIAPSDVDEIVLGHFNAGFSAQDFTASLVLQASPDLRFKRGDAGRECLRHRIRRRASGAASRSPPARARIVLVVGVEQMTTTPAGRDRPQSAQGLLCARGGATSTAALPASSAGSPRAYFQRYGDQSDALALIAAKNHKNGVANPYAQMRKDLGYDFCRTESEKNPLRRRAAQAHRLLAGLRRRRGAGAGRCRDRARNATRRSCSAPPQQVQDFLPMSRRDILKFEGCADGLAARAGRRPASRSMICPSPRCMTASPSPS